MLGEVSAEKGSVYDGGDRKRRRIRQESGEQAGKQQSMALAINKPTYLRK